MTDKPSKAEREAEARRQTFAQRGRERPPSTDLSHLDSLPPGVAVAGTPAVPVTSHVRRAKPRTKPVQPVVQLIVAPADLEQAAGGRRLRGAAAAKAEALPPAATVEPPWATARPDVVKTYPLRIDEASKLKLAWLKTVLPNTSIQKIMMDGISAHVDALLAKHWPPADEK